MRKEGGWCSTEIILFYVLGYGGELSLTSVPRFHQLDLIECKGKRLRIIHAAASKWRNLATRLYFTPSDISRIRSDNLTHCYNACWQVCNEWLNGVGRPPTTWTTLIKALEEADLSEVSKELENIISK